MRLAYLLLALVVAQGALALNISGGSYAVNSTMPGLQTGNASGGGYQAQTVLTDTVTPYGMAPAPTPPVATSGGGGGGGGGGAAPPLPQGIIASASKLTTGITPDSTVTLKIDKTDIAITNLEVHFTASMSQASITVYSFGDKQPNATPSFAGAYQYLQVTHPDFTNKSDTVTLTFAVNTSWLTAHNAAAADIRMYRLEGKDWHKYTPKVGASGASSVSFSVDLPGLSYLAIGVDSVAKPIPSNSAPAGGPSGAAATPPTPPAPSTNTAQETKTQIATASNSSPLIWIIPALIIAGILAILAFTHFARKKPLDKAPMDTPMEEKAANSVTATAAAIVTPASEPPKEQSKPAETKSAEQPKSLDDALHSYIMEMRKRGHTEEEIRKHLLDVKWPVATVERVMKR